MKTNLEELRRIAAKLPSEVTAEEKEAIKTACEDAGIKFAIRKKCPNCIIDLAIKAYGILNKDEQTEAESTAKWAVRPGLDVVYRGRRINATTITDALAEEILAEGFPKMFLVERKQA